MRLVPHLAVLAAVLDATHFSSAKEVHTLSIQKYLKGYHMLHTILPYGLNLTDTFAFG